jgi:hypothetical protein
MFKDLPADYTQRSVSRKVAKKPNRARRVWVAAALSAIAIAAPVSTAAAATATVTGPTYITTAPSTFINNNNQVSSGDISLGGQSA